MEYAYIITILSVTSAILAALSFYNFVDKSNLSKRQLENNDKYIIYLGKEALKTSQAIYRLDRINVIQIIKLKPDYLFEDSTLLIYLFLGTLMLVVVVNNNNYWIILIVIFLYFIAFYAIVERVKKSSNYGLWIQVNIAKSVLLYGDTDKIFLTKVLNLIYEVMNDEGRVNSYIIDFKNRAIKKSNKIEMDNININE
ncbi:MAG: DUF6232 family protein [Cyanobacteria bacterium J06621_8]